MSMPSLIRTEIKSAFLQSNTLVHCSMYFSCNSSVIFLKSKRFKPILRASKISSFIALFRLFCICFRQLFLHECTSVHLAIFVSQILTPLDSFSKESIFFLILLCSSFVLHDMQYFINSVIQIFVILDNIITKFFILLFFINTGNTANYFIYRYSSLQYTAYTILFGTFNI